MGGQGWPPLYSRSTSSRLENPHVAYGAMPSRISRRWSVSYYWRQVGGGVATRGAPMEGAGGKWK
jgi:hypothetical protein